jgi:hypothetical protein
MCGCECGCECECEWVVGEQYVWVRTWLYPIGGAIYVRVWMEDVLGGSVTAWMSKKANW